MREITEPMRKKGSEQQELITGGRIRDSISRDQTKMGLLVAQG